MKTIKKISALILVAAMMLSVFTCGVWADEPNTDSDKKVLAHWKLQNNADYFTGDINTDTLKFIDLSGNGNDLEVATEGNGNQLDIFTWDTGVDNDTLKGSQNASSLKFGNTLAKAKSVDPYESDKTSFSGAYVSGKYLQTVENAPLNSFTGAGGWTIEVIFKVDPEWNNEYNRYTGIFSKQGVVESQNEPAVSLAMGERSTGESDGSLGENGTVGLQYIHVSNTEKKTNEEFQDGKVNANEWMHYMVTSNGKITYLYINGKLCLTLSETNEIFVVDESFGWEVGVGRKLKGSEATMNEQHPEGLIRRLFCGSISEIRFTEGVMDINDSLILENQKTEQPPVTTVTTTTVMPNTDIVTTPVTTVPATDEKKDEKEGGCKSSAVTAICAVVATTAMGVTVLAKKKKED